MLDDLMDLRFSYISRAVDMLCLWLGEDHQTVNIKGEGVLVSEYSLHFQTQWHFRKGGTILLASGDIYEPWSEAVPEDWEYDLVGRPDEQSSVFDVRSRELISKMQNAYVTDIQLSEGNDMTICFSNGVVFEQFMGVSTKAEAWRLIDFKKDSHLVCYDNGELIKI